MAPLGSSNEERAWIVHATLRGGPSAIFACRRIPGRIGLISLAGCVAVSTGIRVTNLRRGRGGVEATRRQANAGSPAELDPIRPGIYRCFSCPGRAGHQSRAPGTAAHRFTEQGGRRGDRWPRLAPNRCAADSPVVCRQEVPHDADGSCRHTRISRRLGFRLRMDAVRRTNPGSDTHVCCRGIYCSKRSEPFGSVRTWSGTPIPAHRLEYRRFSCFLRTIPSSPAQIGSEQRGCNGRCRPSDLYGAPGLAKRLDEQNPILPLDRREVPVNLRRFVLALTVVTAGGLASFLSLAKGHRPVPRRQPDVVKVGFQVGERAPDFALRSLNGVDLRLSNLQGRPVLLNFWATWCAPCRVEMPWLAELDATYRSHGVQIIGVAMESGIP